MIPKNQIKPTVNQKKNNKLNAKIRNFKMNKSRIAPRHRFKAFHAIAKNLAQNQDFLQIKNRNLTQLIAEL